MIYSVLFLVGPNIGDMELCMRRVVRHKQNIQNAMNFIDSVECIFCEAVLQRRASLLTASDMLTFVVVMSYVDAELTSLRSAMMDLCTAVYRRAESVLLPCRCGVLDPTSRSNIYVKNFDGKPI